MTEDKLDYESKIWVSEIRGGVYSGSVEVISSVRTGMEAPEQSDVPWMVKALAFTVCPSETSIVQLRVSGFATQSNMRTPLRFMYPVKVLVIGSEVMSVGLTFAY